MSSKPQGHGVCGHFKNPLDDHDTCLTCAGCSPEHTCTTCRNWSGIVWEQLSHRRSYRERKSKGGSRATSASSAAGQRSRSPGPRLTASSVPRDRSPVRSGCPSRSSSSERSAIEQLDSISQISALLGSMTGPVNNPLVAPVTGHDLPGPVTGHPVTSPVTSPLVSFAGQSLPGPVTGHVVPGPVTGHAMPGPVTGYPVPGLLSGHQVSGPVPMTGPVTGVVTGQVLSGHTTGHFLTGPGTGQSLPGSVSGAFVTGHSSFAPVNSVNMTPGVVTGHPLTTATVVQPQAVPGQAFSGFTPQGSFVQQPYMAPFPMYPGNAITGQSASGSGFPVTPGSGFPLNQGFPMYPSGFPGIYPMGFPAHNFMQPPWSVASQQPISRAGDPTVVSSPTSVPTTSVVLTVVAPMATTTTVSASRAKKPSVSKPRRAFETSRQDDVLSLLAPSRDPILCDEPTRPIPVTSVAMPSVATPLTSTPSALPASSVPRISLPQPYVRDRTSGSGSDREDGELDEETDSVTFSFDKAVNEVFRYLPEDVCPRISCEDQTKFLGFLDKSVDASASCSSFRLPMPPAVDQLVSALDKVPIKHESAGWSVPQSTLSKGLDFSWKSYKFSKETFPLSVPTLDEDASRLHLSAPSSLKLPAKAFTRFEAKARQLLGISAYNNAFIGALYEAIKAPHDALSLQLLIEGMNRCSRHSLGLALALSAELLVARREETLATAPSLSANAKNQLRSAPLSSSKLFGDKIASVAGTEQTDTVTNAALKASSLGKRPASSSFQKKKKGGSGKSNPKRPRLASPLMAVQPVPSKGFPKRWQTGRKKPPTSSSSSMPRTQP